MLPFRTEIRNSPKEQTIKIYVNDVSLDTNIMKMLASLNEIKLVEIQQSVARNRVSKNVTIYAKEEVDINDLHQQIEEVLMNYFSVN
ncbi:hypothetical protein [Urechidicola croceus]|uniref:Uncharacterized protein n=1 Tax=Urechidicola croceus TaxID=1850246 RepID=A0A1D8PAC6_9FLAO|nr:hypothetical protein [Urechidicola croceus]AOW21510.1 hypothetical protein LPB138_12840 [Urechidicola croceus]